MKFGIHWFRRDLRVAGNAALQKQFLENGKNVLCIFCFDKKFLSRPDFSVNRFQFFLETLKSLKSELREIGSDLLVLDESIYTSFPSLIKELKTRGIPSPSLVTWSRDYEPYAIKRDKKFTQLLSELDISFHNERDHLILEPHEIHKNNSDDGYQVYTPFSKKWLEKFDTPEVQYRISLQKNGLKYLRQLSKNEVEKIFSLTWKKLFKGNNPYSDLLSEYLEKNGKKVDIETPKAGSLEAFRQLKTFKKKIDNYGRDRDTLSIKANSGLSIFLKNGSITTSQVIYFLKLKSYSKKLTGEDTFFSELIWREFYYHILSRAPRVERESFNKKYREIKWENNKSWFKKWKEGRTGFPIVDAAMRELNTTGNMHNRARMIVASFLTKDLLIDWRWGEKYFMEKLLDGDIAANNGGWQWAASTGCDAQPYFRIFNPWLQSKKFDPDGQYIKKFVPELKDVESRDIHKPIEHKHYPSPIVDHSAQRIKAISLFKS